MKIHTISLLVLILLLFGCLGIGEAPPAPQPNVSEEKPPAPPITIEEQKNYTPPGWPQPPSPEEIVAAAAKYSYAPNESFSVHFIAVSDENAQGDAILIKKGDADILVDAGPAESSHRLIEFLKAHKVDDIELLILTHADPGHYGGAAAVLGNFSVGGIGWPGSSYGDAAFERLLDSAKEKKIPITALKRGDQKNINGLNLHILNPRPNGFTSADNDAVVIKLTDRKFCILLTSDILRGAAVDIMANHDISCELVQMPFHGELAPVEAWVDNLLMESGAKTVFISGAYRETFGDIGDVRGPLFKLLDGKNIAHYETYTGGAIRIMSDGAEYDIKYVE